MTILAESAPFVPLERYFHRDYLPLHIPPWQRDFDWSGEPDGQVDDLLKDLRTYLSAGPESTKGRYWLGTVLFAQNSTSAGGYVVVDGQQRTTTLFLFLCCAYRYLEARKESLQKNHGVAWENNRVTLRTGAGLGPPVSQVINFQQDEVNKALTKIQNWAMGNLVDMDIQETSSNSIQNIVDATKRIEQTLNDPASWCQEDSFIPWLERLLQETVLLRVTWPDADTALEVFERTNDRGLPLGATDLIKNQLFMKTKPEEYDDLSDHWFTTMSELRKCPGQFAKPKYLLSANIQGFRGLKIEEKALSTSFRKAYFEGTATPGPHEKKVSKFLKESFYKRLPSKDPLEYAKELQRMATNLHKLTTESALGDAQNIHLAASVLAGASQHMAVLLAATYLQDKGARHLLMSQVNRRALLSILAREIPSSFTGAITPWAKCVRSLPTDASAADIKKLHTELVVDNNDLRAGEGYENLLSRVENNLSTWRWENATERKLMRKTLSLLTWRFNLGLDHAWSMEDIFKKNNTEKKQTGWHLDHVWPRKHSTELPGSHADFEDPVNSIGNLVLLSPDDNVAQRDSLPSARRKIENYGHSKLLLTKTLILSRENPRAKRGFSQSEGNRVVETLTKIGIEPGWDLNCWDTTSILARKDLYSKLLILYLKGDWD